MKRKSDALPRTKVYVPPRRRTRRGFVSSGQLRAELERGIEFFWGSRGGRPTEALR